MTDTVKQLVKDILECPEKVEQILNDPNYGRKSVRKDFDSTNYYAQEAIKAIKSDPRIDIKNLEFVEDQSKKGIETPKDRSKEPIDANDFSIPDEWVYDKHYVYNPDDDTYVFMTREFGNIVKSGAWVKNIVQAYSNWDGDADTINEVCRKFGVTRALFNEIKSILGLTHDHEPFTPEEIKEKTSEEMAQEAFQMKRFETKQQFDKMDWKQTQKEAKKWRNLEASILEEVKMDAPAIVVDPILPEDADVKVEEAVLHTGDWHLGAKAENLPNIPDFNPTILKGMITEMVKLVRTDFPDTKFHVHINGDLIETVTGLNHADSWKAIESGYYGAKPILEAEKLALNLVSGLRPESVHAVTGNHGRITSDRRKDHSGEAELIVYQHLADRLDGVDVHFDDTEILHTVQDIGYIMTHGHLKMTGKSEQNMVRGIMNKFDRIPEFILYEQGHTHSREVKADTNLYRHIVIPSLFTGSKYSERNGYGNMAGFTVTYRHPITQKIKVEDYSL